MEAFDFAVMGAGPAGLAAAISYAARAFETAPDAGSPRALVLEKMPRPALKLLASGSGQCNFSHAGPIDDFLGHYGVHGKFLRAALRSFDNRAFVAFLEARGVPVEESEGGKLFPRSRRARDVLDALLSECAALGVEIRTGAPLLAVERAADGFLLDTPRGKVLARSLCLAAGGSSYPGTGSAGDGYAIARALGHSVAEIGPALAPAYPEPWDFGPCAGIALRDARISLHRGGRKVASGAGDVLFTHRGLSGPGILDLSRDLRPGDELRLRLRPGEQGDHDAAIQSLAAASGAKSLKNCLFPLGLPETLLLALLASLGIDASAKAAALRRDDRRKLAGALAFHPFKVARLGGWEEAMATRGGVELAEVDPATMGSRLVPGLSFAGELLDLDGDTGGYNIQAAISTGTLAGSKGRRPTDRHGLHEELHG